MREDKREEDDEMSVKEKNSSAAEALTEAFKEVEKMRKGEQAKVSWKEMLKKIQEDKESGKL